MKQTIISLSLIFGTIALFAQSKEEGFRQLYYKRYQSAENTFREVVKHNPNDAEAWYAYTRALLLNDKTEKAKETLQSAPSSVESQPWLEVAHGAVFLYLNKTDSASFYFNKALNQTKEKNPGILSAIARAHINSKNGNANYAIELVNKALKRDKGNPALLTTLGDAYLKLANGTEAYKAYAEAIKKDNRYAAAHHKLGTIFLGQKNTDLFLEHFSKAVAADTNYAPSLYKLYVHYFQHNPARSLQYYRNYASKSDRSIENEYELADLLYVNKNYNEAVNKAKKIIASEGQQAKPRLYKLIAYSYAEQKDSVQAMTYMKKYFSSEADSNFIAKDYETMAVLFAQAGNTDSSIAYFEKAVALEKDPSSQFKYYKELADLSKTKKDYTAQAQWLAKYYTGNDEANNVDLFNWAIANYLAQDYQNADSVFGMYTQKYPDQAFGYYWRARSNVAIDTAMAEGLAVPHYQKLIEVLAKDTVNTNYKKWMSEAYGYLAAYEANTQKDYAEAIDYFEKVLNVDPENENARKYITMLEKNLEGEEGK